MLPAAVHNKTLPRAVALRGAGLIEVLIALVIFALGVVGMAGLQLRTMSVTMDSTQRSFVVAKSQDVADRIRSNGIPVGLYLNTYSDQANFCDTPVSPVCSDVVGTDVTDANACTPAQMVAYDLYDAYCIGEGSFDHKGQVADWQVMISCDYPLAGVMTSTTDCSELGATVTIETSWFGRSVSNDTAAADGQIDSMILRFVP